MHKFSRKNDASVKIRKTETFSAKIWTLLHVIFFDTLPIILTTYCRVKLEKVGFFDSLFLVNFRSFIPIGREEMYYIRSDGRIHVFLGIGLH
jgi:hypothetical protein